ncbi:hypothetical protein [Halovenus marina]|uniref:hypothetical protein n=1 Tax=Halovenus marina TaxID=3396621 RepID=UPI003F56FD6F
MKSKLFALALAAAAVMAVGVGGVAAADGASPDTVQIDDQSAEQTEDAEDDEATKLTADDSFSMDLEEKQMRSNGDGVIVVSLEGDFSGFPASFDEPVEPPEEDHDYDQKLTADQAFTGTLAGFSIGTDAGVSLVAQ